MNITELKKLAEGATPGKRKEYAPEINGEIDVAYRYIEIGGGTTLRNWISKDDAAFIAACDPDAISKLLQINAELVEALKEISTDYADRFDLESPSTNHGIKSSIALARAALAKAEGGEL